MLTSPDHFARNMLDVFANFPQELAKHRRRPLNLHNPADLKIRANHNRIYQNIITRPGDYRQALYTLFEQTGQWLIENEYPLIKPVAKGLGVSALFFEVGEKGVRFEGQAIKRPVHDLMLPADQNIFHPQLISTAEILPLVDTTHNTQQDVDNLVHTARQQNLIYKDPKPENQGPFQRKDWDKPRQVVTDPGAAFILVP